MSTKRKAPAEAEQAFYRELVLHAILLSARALVRGGANQCEEDRLIEAVTTLVKPQKLALFKKCIDFNDVETFKESIMQLQVQFGSLICLIADSQRSSSAPSAFSDGVLARTRERANGPEKRIAALKKSIAVALDMIGLRHPADEIDEEVGNDTEFRHSDVADAKVAFKPVPGSIHGKARLEWYPVKKGTVFGRVMDGVRVRTCKDDGRGKLKTRDDRPIGTIDYSSGEMRVVKAYTTGIFSYSFLP